MKKSLLTWATTLAVVGAMALPALAGGGGGGGGGRGGRGGAGGGAGGAGGGAGGGGFGGGAGGGAGGGGFGGGRGGDPVAQVTNTLAGIRTALNITADDEWNVLAAKIQKVLEAKQKLAPGQPNAFGGGGRGGRGGAGGGAMGGGAGGGPPVDATNPLAVAMGDLNTATAAGTTTADADLKTKLAAVRTARTTALKGVTDAQADLQKVVTVRQEAILVTRGVLD